MLTYNAYISVIFKLITFTFKLNLKNLFINQSQNS